jgi:DNA-binding response OmpR family regulator
VAALLVVEDDEDIASGIEMLLTDVGHEVRVARNGEEGLAQLSRRLPDIVIMDVEMPILTGPDMAERMFVHNLGRENIPIVIASASAGLHQTAARVGTPYYLSKPFYPDELVAIVDRALREQILPRPTP